jgi:ADP-ribosylglycohydrolase
MKTNRELLDDLFEEGAIDIKRGRIFDTPVVPVAEDFDYGRIEGMMLGLAVGDSLGITSEGMLPQHRRERHGEIRDYIPNRYVDEAIGFPSDDTQLAFWTLEQMIVDGGFNPGRVAEKFCNSRIFGLGASVRQFIANYRSGLPWHKCGPPSAGNGALMRIAPMIIPHLKSSTTDLRADTALSAMLTHNDSGSIAACLAFVEMLRQLLQMSAPPDPMWWVESYTEIAADLETGKVYRPRGGRFVGYEGPVWRFVAEKVYRAREKKLSVLDACNEWYSGAYLLETIPGVIYIMMRHGHDFEEALVRAVNDTRDNDTIAAIVGALAGALHGKEQIPDRWLRNLSGRTTDSDDGKIFEILKGARRAWAY